MHLTIRVNFPEHRHGKMINHWHDVSSVQWFKNHDWGYALDASGMSIRAVKRGGIFDALPSREIPMPTGG